MSPAHDISAVILAGGAGTRMGGRDKGWLEIAGEPLVRVLLNRLAPQCARIVISANRHLEDYAGLGVTVLTDGEFAGAGPLAGIYAALVNCATPALLTVAVDTPFIPPDFTSRFARQAQQSPICVAHDGLRAHPVCALIAKDTLASLEQFLRDGHRRVMDWQQPWHPAQVDFSDAPAACFNINTPDDLVRAARDWGQMS